MMATRYQTLLLFITAAISLPHSKGAEALRRLTGVQVDNLPKNASLSCLLGGDLAPDNITRRLYDDAFVVGAYQTYRHVEHDLWIRSLFSCAASFERENVLRSDSTEHRGQFCYGQKDDKVVGACLRKQCQGSSATDIMLSMLQTGKRPTGSHQSTELHNVVCIPTLWEKPWYQKVLPLLAIASECVIASMLICSTIYHYWLRRRNATADGVWKNLLLCFSVRANLPKLAKVPNDPAATIACLSGLRFLSMVWTTVGHSYLLMLVFVKDREGFVESLRGSFLAQIVTNFTLSTDVFFLLSGTLSAYSWFRKIQKAPKEKQASLMSVGYWLRYYRHRIVRLWPPYAVLLWQIWVRYSIAYRHPQWPLVDPTEQCPSTWWQNMLFLNSIFPNRCLPWLWYLGTDFIFYLLSPLFLLAIHRRPTVGVPFTITVIGLSAMLRAVVTVVYNFPPTQFLWFQSAGLNPDFVAHHLVIYTKPYTRIGTYLVGILLGYVLAAQPVALAIVFAKSSPPARIVRLLCWLAAVYAGLWALFGVYPATQSWGDGVDVRWIAYNTFYAAVHRTVFALSVGWLILSSHRTAANGGGKGWLNAVLGCRLVVPLANLSYGAYLFHLVPILGSYMWTRPFPIEWQGHLVHLGRFVLPQVLTSYAAGLSIALMVEMPALNIERLLLTGSSKKAVAACRLDAAAKNSKGCALNIESLQNNAEDAAASKLTVAVTE